MNPTMNSAHVDVLLSNLMQGFINTNYIYPEVFPVVKTDGVESGNYGLFTQKDWYRNEAETIAPGGTFPMGGYKISTDTWNTKEIGIGTSMADRTYNNATGVFKKTMRLGKARWLTDRVEMAWEIRLANQIFTTGTWGTDDTETTDWDDYVNSNPMLNIADAIYAIESANGNTPKVLILGNKVYKDLRFSPIMLDYLGSNERGMLKKSDLVEAFELDKILVGKSIYNTANENQEAVYTNCWGNNALLLYVAGAPTPDPFTASAGYFFESRGMQIKNWREGGRDAEFFRGSKMRDLKVTGAGLGYFWSSIVSA